MDGSVRKGATLIAIAILGAAMAFIAWKAAIILLLIFAGIVFAIFLRGGAKWLSNQSGLSVQNSLAIIIVLLAIVTALGVIFAVPRIAEQADDLVKSLPQFLTQIRRTIAKYGWGQFLLNQVQSTEITSGELISRVAQILKLSAWTLTGIFVMLFLGFYIAIDPHPYLRGFFFMLPKKHHKRAQRIMDHIERHLQRWLLSRLVSMLTIGALTTIGLAMLDVPLPFTLGIATGLMSFVPNIGPLLSGALAAAVGLTVSVELAFSVVVLYLFVQIVESYFVTPMVEQKVGKLPPAFVISVELIMGWLFGFIGLFVATPLAVVLMILIRDLRRER